MPQSPTTGALADWSDLLPEILKPINPPTMEQFSDALQAVATSYEQGYINKAEADILLRHLCSAFIANEVMGLLSSLASDPFQKRQKNETSDPMGLFSALDRR